MPSQPSSPLRAAVAANIDRAIVAAGLTNRAVGESIGATEHQVWRWRRGRTRPSQRYAVALADVLFDGNVGALYAGRNAEAEAA
jgi:transcriptional regulator with XRE-family HTH domain